MDLVWCNDELQLSFIGERNEHFEIFRPGAADHKNFFVPLECSCYLVFIPSVSNLFNAVKTGITGNRNIVKVNGSQQLNRFLILNEKMSDVLEYSAVEAPCFSEEVLFFSKNG